MKFQEVHPNDDAVVDVDQGIIVVKLPVESDIVILDHDQKVFRSPKYILPAPYCAFILLTPLLYE